MLQMLVIFKNSEWIYEISPRVGFSHVITDDATFTFNYGVYNQTPVYENIYFNTSRQEDPEEVFEESAGFIGNATMSAMRTQSYEFAFNVQGGRNWAYTVGAWVKDMDQLVSSKVIDLVFMNIRLQVMEILVELLELIYP